jgi:uncharacterized membrane protein
MLGKMVEGGVDKAFVKEVSESLQPGNSALFLIAKEANAPAVRAALQPYRGKLYHSNLSSEAEESLRSVIEKGGHA